MPLGAYTATFTVNSVVYGFDVRTSSYDEDTQANLTTYTIPWSQTYTVIVQGAAANPGDPVGSLPVTRKYRAIVYTETDYLNLRGQRGQIGTLITAREPGPLGAGYSAVLTNCRRGDFQNPSDAAGAQSIEVEFTMLQ